MIDTYCRENLHQIKIMLTKIGDDDYTHTSNMLAGASIGAHVRHVLEFYTCLLSSFGTVNYDGRQRNQLIENSKVAAIDLIDNIVDLLQIPTPDKAIVLVGVYSPKSEELLNFNTTLYRELAYCLEHSIHHQALMKISLIELNLVDVIDENFGLAPATIIHRATCAQ